MSKVWDDYHRRMDRIRKRYAKRFQELFSVPIDSFWDEKYGLDIARFDNEFIHSPDGKSLDESIREQYGPEAFELFNRICKEKWAIMPNWDLAHLNLLQRILKSIFSVLRKVASG